MMSIREPTPSVPEATVKVSVALCTYNHERYIAQAIESALRQNATFKYEIVIADDCSQDRTQAIIRAYQQRYPEQVRLIARPVNLGSSKSIVRLYGECRGEFVAYLSGDDYWTSSDKLQKQVDLLESRPDLTVCYHRVRVVPQHAPESFGFHPMDGQAIVSSVEELLRGDCFTASSTMVRKLFMELPKWCEDCPIEDWPVFSLHATRGGIGYLPDLMADYRLHTESIWSSLPRVKKLPGKIETRERVAAALGAPYDAILAPVIAKLKAELRALQAN